LAGESVNLPRPRKRDQLHRARLAGLEAHRGARRDVEPAAVGLLAVELERGVGLVKVVMRADLDRAVARVLHRERNRLPALVELDVARCGLDLAGNHGIGLCTVTSL